MINYLKGIVTGIDKSTANRVILTIEVNGLGYEVQVPARLLPQLPSSGEVQIFTHFQMRDEVPLLYGFAIAAERDVFRLLLSVSGIGAASAIALIDTFELSDLVQAIITSNTVLLIKTPGIGGKTAERICLELKKKLAGWRISAGLTVATGSPAPAVMDDVQMTLLALGYTPGEVAQALQVISQEVGLGKDSLPEDWIRQAIAHLSSK